MTSHNHNDRWRDLCDAIMREPDSARLMELVEKLNQILEECEEEVRRRTDGQHSRTFRNAEPTPRFRYSHPLVRAMRAASTRFPAPSFLIASER
jgi:hypothetical protein